MRILVLGAGAIGAYYGARMIQAGADLTFAVRARRRASLDETGLKVHSALGDFAGYVRTVDAKAVTGGFDAVLLACKGYDLAQAMNDIAPAMGPHTVVLPFLNGLGAYSLLDRRFGRDRVLGGVAYIASTLDQDGAIRHMGQGDVLLLGARSTDAAAVDAARTLHLLFQASAGTRVLADDIGQALWDKWAMLASGATLTCLMRGAIADILAAAGGLELAELAIAECESVAAADGYPVSAKGMARTRTLLLDPESHWMASMMRDIAQAAPRIEHEEIIGDMARLARRYALDTPLIDAAYCHLQVYAAQMAR